MSFSRKDLILLQKYKDDNYKRALAEHIISLVKYEVIRTAMSGETVVRVSSFWASTKEELEGLEKEVKIVRDQLKEVFDDSLIEIETNRINLIFYEFYEIVIKVTWG
jgi:hypothetical protein